MHLLISGIPASGKSTFCRWLAKKKRFLHIDVEESGALERHGLLTAWEAMFVDGASATPFLEALEKIKRPVAIDWGFPQSASTRSASSATVESWSGGSPRTGRLREANLHNVATHLFKTLTFRQRKSERLFRISIPSFAPTLSTHYPLRASTRHPTKSGRACLTP